MASTRRSSSSSVPNTPREPVPAAVSRPARITFALLLLASVAALLLAQHLKDRHALIDSAAWTPAGHGFEPLTQTASFSFKPYYHDRLTVSIVSDRTGRVIAVVRRDMDVVGWQRTATIAWNGRTSSGAPAPPGYYGVEVHFARLDRTTIVPELTLEVAP
jgi:hypothetical protein